MRKLLKSVSGLCCMLLLVASASAAPRSLPELATAFEAAYRSGQVESLEALTCLDGVTSEEKARLRSVFQMGMGQQLEKVEFVDLPANFSSEVQVAGKARVYNLKPSHKLVAAIKKGPQFGMSKLSYMVGERAGEYFITVTIEKQ